MIRAEVIENEFAPTLIIRERDDIMRFRFEVDLKDPVRAIKYAEQGIMRILNS